jgi:phage protein D
VVASPPAASAGPFAAAGATQCIFDGVVLSHKIRLTTGTSRASLTVWAQDVTWLMNLQEKTREWIDLTDADVAAAIFSEYGILPADENTDEDSPSHTEAGHSLMQRGSDIQFLRMLARRNGKLCRITSDAIPGLRTGYFAKPSLDGQPQVRIDLNDPQNWTVGSLDLEWDATKPTSIVARQALFTSTDASGVSGDTSDSGLRLLAKRGLADFTQRVMTVLLAAPVDDAGELTQRAQAVLREADWFVRAVGEADVERFGTVLRAGMLVALDGIGQVHSGTYLVWSVHHRITRQAHAMKFTLVRNAVGPPAGGAAGIPGLP